MEAEDVAMPVSPTRDEEEGTTGDGMLAIKAY
jgi:hypothetical protein